LTFLCKTEPKHGYGTEALKLVSNYAFSELGAKRVCVRIYQINPISFRFATKAGFKYEKTTNDGYTVDGTLYLEDWLYLDSPIK